MGEAPARAPRPRRASGNGGGRSHWPPVRAMVIKTMDLTNGRQHAPGAQCHAQRAGSTELSPPPPLAGEGGEGEATCTYACGLAPSRRASLAPLPRTRGRETSPRVDPSEMDRIALAREQRDRLVERQAH